MQPLPTTPIYHPFATRPTQPGKPALSRLGAVQQDVFFSSRTLNPVEELINKHHGSLYQLVQSVIDTPNRGEGFNGACYDIPNTPYVIKVPHFIRRQLKKGNDAELKKNQSLTLVVDPFPGWNMGQAVAKNDRFAILKNVKGVPNGIAAMRDGVFLRSPDKQSTLEYEDSIKRLAQMPYAGYQYLATLFKKLEESPYEFDNTPGNLVVDLEQSRITPVDWRPASEDKKEYQSIDTLLGSLLDQMDYEPLTTDRLLSDDQIEKLRPLRQKIIKNMLCAGFEAQIPMLPPDYELDYSWSELGQILKDSGLENTLDTIRVLYNSKISPAAFKAELERIIPEP